MCGAVDRAVRRRHLVQQVPAGLCRQVPHFTDGPACMGSHELLRCDVLGFALCHAQPLKATHQFCRHLSISMRRLTTHAFGLIHCRLPVPSHIDFVAHGFLLGGSDSISAPGIHGAHGGNHARGEAQLLDTLSTAIIAVFENR